jgi:hypothetical protein
MIRRDTTTSVDEAAQATAITAYPNPFDNVIVIRHPDEAGGELTLRDIRGMVHIARSIEPGQPLTVLSMPQIPAGMYAIEYRGRTCQVVKVP